MHQKLIIFTNNKFRAYNFKITSVRTATAISTFQ